MSAPKPSSILHPPSSTQNRKSAIKHAKAWRSRKVEHGLCPNCGGETRDFNKRTGKPYKFGPACRRIKNEYQKRLMKKRRAALK